ncbi:SDR family NAD(P)-dependent oxidoreductase [Mycobacterium gastri]|uniref:SDR family NAD(P)-dependent oxidoreductase n=1 Tax=Mycobacterium gastri TaxID=1777 RepID=UPI002448A4AD|nr:SDR family NAD(P)-dependent oxidoreductase [Mycobacterium gastri]
MTGAARGIGLAIAKSLAARGHRVLLTDLDGDAVEHAAHAVGPSAWGVAQDVRDAVSHDAVAALRWSEVGWRCGSTMPGSCMRVTAGSSRLRSSPRHSTSMCVE